eukprot:346299_1
MHIHIETPPISPKCYGNNNKNRNIFCARKAPPIKKSKTMNASISFPFDDIEEKMDELDKETIQLCHEANLTLELNQPIFPFVLFCYYYIIFCVLFCSFCVDGYHDIYPYNHKLFE